MESSSSLVFCVSGDLLVKTSPMTESFVRYSYLRPTKDSVNRVGGMLVFLGQRAIEIYLLADD